MLDGVVLPPDWNKTFTGFLHKIQITRCNLTRLASHTFIQVEGLQAIDISQNEIRYLAEGTFSGLTHLVTINMESNILSSLPEGIFEGLLSLANILLRGNLLTSIDAMTFLNLHSLKRIDLSENQIRHISDEAMGRESSDFTQLTHIDLKQNDLGDFPIWLLQLRFLVDIDLSHNRISFDGLISVLSRIPSIEYIAYGNRQSSSTTDNNFLPATTKNIRFRNNAFADFNMTGLMDEKLLNFQLLLNYFQVDFSGNEILCNCNMYRLYNYLRRFDTKEPRDYNHIGVLPYNMNSIKCQKPVDLRGIPLVKAPATSLGCYTEVPGCPQDCQCWVRTVDEVVKVICSNKSLTQLPESLPYNTTELDFSGNLLVSLPQDIPDYLLSINVLDLNTNLLDHLDGWLFERLTETSELKLHGNQLTSLPSEVSCSHLIDRY